MRGSLVLIGGEPGIGKSTLILQTVLALKGQKVLYVSGEESARQLKLRAERIGGNAPDCYIVCETSLEDIFVHIRNVAPDIVVIDSIQTIATSAMESSPGSVGQVRECAASLLKFAKQTNTPVLLVGRQHCRAESVGAHCRYSIAVRGRSTLFIPYSSLDKKSVRKHF